MKNVKSAIYKLLPTGECWPPETEETNLRGFVYGIARSIIDLQTDLEVVMDAYYPGQGGIFLSDWEELLKLPKCGQQNQDIQTRIAQVLTMFRLSPYSTATFFEEIAAVFGYTITVYPASHPHDPVGDPFAINIETPGAITYFTIGESQVGDPLKHTTVNSSLTCLLEFFKLAHTHIVYV